MLCVNGRLSRSEEVLAGSKSVKLEVNHQAVVKYLDHIEDSMAVLGLDSARQKDPVCVNIFNTFPTLKRPVWLLKETIAYSTPVLEDSSYSRYLEFENQS